MYSLSIFRILIGDNSTETDLRSNQEMLYRIVDMQRFEYLHGATYTMLRIGVKETRNCYFNGFVFDIFSFFSLNKIIFTYYLLFIY